MGHEPPTLRRAFQQQARSEARAWMDLVMVHRKGFAGVGTAQTCVHLGFVICKERKAELHEGMVSWIPAGLTC